jgi:hypothetical protein
VAEKERGLTIFAAGQATLSGRDFLQAPSNSSVYSQNFSKGEADFLSKRQLFDAVTPDYYAEIVPVDELPQINVVESFHLPNDDIDRRGC